MSTIKVKRGLEANRSVVTPLEGELIYTTDNKELFIGDGTTAGGNAISKSPAQLLADIKTVDGNGSGLDADKLDGLETAEASTGNSIVMRTGEGDINVRLIRSEYDTTNPSINYVMTQVDTATNNYVRPSTIAQLRTSLNVENGATADQSAAELLVLIKTVDGSGSGLDADLLDGLNSGQFIRSDTSDVAAGNHQFYGTDITGIYSGSSVELREVNLVSTAQTSDAYAPALGFHWGSTGQGQIALESDSVFRFRDGVTHSTMKAVGMGNLTVTGAITATGDITAFFSDARLKDVEKPVTGAIDSIMNWNAVHYTANQTAGDLGYDMELKQVGLLTQDIEVDYPEFVKDAPINIDNGTDFKTLDYARIVAVLTAGMQEQQEMIKSLQDRLTLVESK